MPWPSPQGSSWDAGEPLEQPGALFHAGIVAPGSRDHWKCSDCGKEKLRQIWITGISRKKVGMRQESAPLPPPRQLLGAISALDLKFLGSSEEGPGKEGAKHSQNIRGMHGNHLEISLFPLLLME